MVKFIKMKGVPGVVKWQKGFKKPKSFKEQRRVNKR